MTTGNGYENTEVKRDISSKPLLQSRSQNWLGIVTAVCVLAFAVFVWPTLYRFEQATVFGERQSLVCINRVTGTVYVLQGANGWRSLSEIQKEQKKAAEELERLRWNLP